MKSIFLFTTLASLMMASVASAQMSTRPSPKEINAPKKTTFDGFWDRLKIGYFSVLTSPTYHDMRNGKWNQSALDEGYAGNKQNRDTWPTNIWHQLSFNFNFGAKLNFVVNPRFMTPLVNSKYMGPPEDRAFLMIDDALIGFQGVIYNTEDKAFNLWIRPGIRVPTSRASRNTGNGGAGATSQQAELAYNATYDFNKTFQLGVFGQFRQWVIEDKYGFDRFRIYTAPFFQYTLNDVSRIIGYWELYMETDRRSKPADDRDPVFKSKTQDAYVGLSYDITPKFNVYPYVGVFLDNTPIDDRSFWLGAWISYSIK